MPALVKNPARPGGGSVCLGAGPFGPRPQANQRQGAGAEGPRSLALCALRAPAAPPPAPYGRQESRQMSTMGWSMPSTWTSSISSPQTSSTIR